MYIYLNYSKLWEETVDSFIFSVNAVMPIFLLIFLGKILNQLKVIDKKFSDGATSLVFKVALPVILFNNISSADFSGIANVDVLRAVTFCVVSIFISFLFLTVCANKGIISKSKRGAFIQGTFRSNYIIIGLPIIDNIMGSQGVVTAAMIMAFVIPVFNILAVLTLSLNDDSKNKIDIGHILVNIAKNPLIISIVIGLVFAYFKIELPVFVNKSMGLIADVAIPLALLAIGVFFSFDKFFANIKLAAISSAIKTIVLPSIFTVLAYLIGLRDEYLLATYVLFASPAAVSSYIMAKAMNSDGDLAGNIVIVTTIMSLFTFFSGVFILKSIGLI